MKKNLFLIIFLFTSYIYGQSFSIVEGYVYDENNQPIENVNVTYNDKGTTTDENGFYRLKVSSEKQIQLLFSHTSYQSQIFYLKLKKNEVKKLKVLLKTLNEQITEVIIKGKNRKETEGAIKIDKINIEVIPGAQGGVENILKTLPSASGFDEMSSQYMVRGGNFDENQVYINGIEVYRPFLIRSGQQEGLSFVNSDLVENIYFYPGGFAANKGDKLSSVLDITYKTPTKNKTGVNLSLLGGDIHHQLVKGKFKALTGLRYRNNSLLVNSKDVQVDYHPVFIDFQTLLQYKISKQLNVSFLGNISQNLYNYRPIVKVTNFGSYQEPKIIVINYEGQEKDKYKTFFGAAKVTYKPHKQNKWEVIFSAYNTQEEEYFDILGKYAVGEPNTDLTSNDFGNPENLESLGSEINHARNDLDAFITNLSLNYFHKINNNNKLEMGVKVTVEDIKDRINEWQVIDSAGFSLYPPGSFQIEEPYDLDTAPILPYQHTKGFNHVNIQRGIAYILWRHSIKSKMYHLAANIGLRGQYYFVNNIINQQATDKAFVSPRILVSIKPFWEHTKMEFRIATGVYQQAPFYKEYRNQQGLLNLSVQPQKSYIFSLSNDWYFDIWKRPFKLTSEVYYKYLWDVNPYTLENIRIRYFANNDATAFAYGFESRLNGEFIKGIESWVSFSLMKTMENINNRGYIYRPVDQRFKFAMLFQDYVPKMPNMQMYLNLVFNGGIPTGSPTYADPYDFQFRTDNYFRTDMGFFYIINEKNNTRKFWKKFEHASIGLEILNIFNVKNSISNMWIRDIYSKKVYRVKNYLTNRIFNVKLKFRL